MADFILTDDGQRLPFVKPVAEKKQAAVKVVAPLAIDEPSLEETESQNVDGKLAALKEKFTLVGDETNKDIKALLDSVGVKYAKNANRKKLDELIAPYILVAVEEEVEL